MAEDAKTPLQAAIENAPTSATTAAAAKKTKTALDFLQEADVGVYDLQGDEWTWGFKTKRYSGEMTFKSSYDESDRQKVSSIAYETRLVPVTDSETGETSVQRIQIEKDSVPYATVATRILRVDGDIFKVHPKYLKNADGSVKMDGGKPVEDPDFKGLPDPANPKIIYPVGTVPPVFERPDIVKTWPTMLITAAFMALQEHDPFGRSESGDATFPAVAGKTVPPGDQHVQPDASVEPPQAARA